MGYLGQKLAVGVSGLALIASVSCAKPHVKAYLPSEFQAEISREVAANQKYFDKKSYDVAQETVKEVKSAKANKTYASPRGPIEKVVVNTSNYSGHGPPLDKGVEIRSHDLDAFVILFENTLSFMINTGEKKGRYWMDYNADGTPDTFSYATNEEPALDKFGVNAQDVELYRKDLIILNSYLKQLK